MPQININGLELEVDGDGFLLHPQIWNEEIAQLLAKTDGTGELEERHWKVIHFIREYWQEKDMAPMIRNVCQSSNLRLKEIYDLFPLGPAKGACKIAGLPKPDGCV
jgi:dissimilatory sulfite reductase related protein